LLFKNVVLSICLVLHQTNASFFDNCVISHYYKHNIKQLTQKQTQFINSLYPNSQIVTWKSYIRFIVTIFTQSNLYVDTIVTVFEINFLYNYTSITHSTSEVKKDCKSRDTSPKQVKKHCKSRVTSPT